MNMPICMFSTADRSYKKLKHTGLYCDSEISVKEVWCLTLATPHSYCAANVRRTKAFPVTALWGIVDRSEALGELPRKACIRGRSWYLP